MRAIIKFVVAALGFGASSSVGAQLPPVARLDPTPRYSTHVETPCKNQPRTYRALRAAFESGRKPTVAELQGTWAAIGLSFLSHPSDAKSSRPDLACAGIQRGSSGVFESVLIVHADTLTVDRIGLGDRVLSAPITYNGRGSLTFRVDDTGDMYNFFLACRLTARHTLACLGGFDRPKSAIMFGGEEYARIPVKLEDRALGREQARIGLRLPPVSVSGKAIGSEKVQCADCPGGGATWPLEMRRAFQEKLAAGRRQWNANRPESYQISCGDGSAQYRPPDSYPIARIRGSTLVATGTFVSAQHINGGNWITGPVEQLFDLLERTLRDSPRRLDELTLDSTYGFPRTWSTNSASNGYRGALTSDQDDWGRVVRFVPERVPPPCGWWHRLLRSCPAPLQPLDNEILTRASVDEMARPAVNRPAPEYPPILEGTAADGSVRVRYAIDPTGHVRNYSLDVVFSQLGELTGAVWDLLEKSVFVPARLHGRRVSVWYDEEFDFRAPRSIHPMLPNDTGFSLPPDLFENVRSVIRDTTQDGVPRTRIGFLPPAPTPDGRFSRSELFDAQRSALRVLAGHVVPDSATGSRATMCISMYSDAESVTAAELDSTLRVLSSPTRSSVSMGNCPPTGEMLNEVDSLGRHPLPKPPGWSEPTWIWITRVLGWTPNELRVWAEMTRGGARDAFGCVATRMDATWRTICTRTAHTTR